MKNAFPYAPIGFSFNVSVAAQTLAISTYVPQPYRGQVTGLLGNYDGDPGNDFIAPDGTIFLRMQLREKSSTTQGSVS